MSVYMSLRIKADPNRFMEAVDADPERLERIVERAKQAGAIHHRFMSGDGELLVVDEWPDRESFLKFFESEEEIPQLMADSGVTERPTPSFWTDLDTPDRF